MFMLRLFFFFLSSLHLYHRSLAVTVPCKRKVVLGLVSFHFIPPSPSKTRWTSSQTRTSIGREEKKKRRKGRKARHHQKEETKKKAKAQASSKISWQRTQLSRSRGPIPQSLPVCKSRYQAWVYRCPADLLLFTRYLPHTLFRLVENAVYRTYSGQGRLQSFGSSFLCAQKTNQTKHSLTRPLLFFFFFFFSFSFLFPSLPSLLSFLPRSKQVPFTYGHPSHFPRQTPAAADAPSRNSPEYPLPSQGLPSLPIYPTVSYSFYISFYLSGPDPSTRGTGM